PGKQLKQNGTGGVDIGGGRDFFRARVIPVDVTAIAVGRETKVRELDVIVGRKQQIAGPQIAVADAVVVSALQCKKKLLRQQYPLAERRGVSQPVLQAARRQVFTDRNKYSLVFACAIEPPDMGMIHMGQFGCAKMRSALLR